MNAVCKKLNFKDQDHILALHVPPSFEPILDDMRPAATVHQRIEDLEAVDFAIAFATMQSEVDRYAAEIVPRLRGDALLWIAYPKASSKRYRCAFNRDTGWEALGQAGLEPVRQVALDDEWSALRFRKVAFIKTITRREGFAISQEAKQRTSGKGK